MGLCFRIPGIVLDSEKASIQCSLNEGRCLHWNWCPPETVCCFWRITGYSWGFHLALIQIWLLTLLRHEVVLRTRSGIKSEFSVKWQGIAKFYLYGLQHPWKKIIPTMKVGVEKRWRRNTRIYPRRSELGPYSLRLWKTFHTFQPQGDNERIHETNMFLWS